MVLDPADLRTSRPASMRSPSMPTWLITPIMRPSPDSRSRASTAVSSVSPSSAPNPSSMNKTGLDAVPEHAHVADHADHAPVARQPLQGVDCRLQRLPVKRAEPLVDEHRFEASGGGVAGQIANAARQGERQGEGGEKRFAPR